MRLLTDENFNGSILRGLIRRLPKLDVVRIQDVGLIHADDPTILEGEEFQTVLGFDLDKLITVEQHNLGKIIFLPHRLSRSKS